MDNTTTPSSATPQQIAQLNALAQQQNAGGGISPQQDAINEEAKRQAAFSQPRNDYQVPSQAFLDINNQYAQQHNQVVGSGVAQAYQPAAVNPFNPNTAAGIAWEVNQSGGTVGSNLAYKSASQGYGVTTYQKVDQAIVPMRDLSSNAQTRAENLGYTTYDLQAMDLATLRAGYSTGLGDRYTQTAMIGLGAMQMMGFNVASPNELSVLNMQRNAARYTETTIDDRFYMNELQKGVQNKVELSSAYHHMGMKMDTPIPANRFEYQGDLAVELLKGQPGKASEWFSPVSGEMSKYLVGGEGLQGYAWRGARDGVGIIGASDFNAGINKLISAEGQYGPYGKLYGGPDYRGSPSSQKGLVNSWEIAAIPAAYVPFRNGGTTLVKGSESFLGERTGITPTTPLGVEVAIGEGSLPKPFRAGGVASVEAPPQPGWLDPFQSSIRSTFAVIPGGIGFAMASDMAFAQAKSNPKEMPFYDLIKDISTPYSKKEGSVTSSQYESSLESYNTRVEAYKAEQLAYGKSSDASMLIYNTKLQSFNTDKAMYERGGSTDAAMFSNLKTRYSELQAMQPGLDAQKGSFDKLQGTYGQLESDRLSLDKQSKNIENPPSAFDSIGKLYESANKGLAPYTTDISGIGKRLEATPDIDLKKYGDTSGVTGYSDAINFSKGAYVGASQHPLDIALTYVGGGALGLGERVVAGGVAKAAMGELPLLSRVSGVATVGRAFSTPFASDLVTIGKVGFGGFVAYEAGANILAQPTATGRGEATGRTAIQFGGFGAGMVKSEISALPGEVPNRFSNVVSGYNDYLTSTPTNDFAGRTMKGVLMDSPLETARSYASMQLNRLTMPAEESAIYRNNWDVARAIKYIEPYKLTEPNVGQLSRVPQEHVTPIENTVRDVPFVGQGSGFVQAQRSPFPTGDRLGPSKDLDAFSKGFMDRLAQEPGAMRMSVSTPHGGGVKDTIFINQKPVAADIHEFPKGYPNVGQNTGVASRPVIGLPESKAPDVHDVGLGTRLLGQPLKPQPASLSQIRNPTAEGKPGDIFRYEKENIQAQRVLEATNRDLQTLSGENTRGYRLEKDVYRSKTVPEELIAVERARGTPQSKAMEPLFKKADAALADNMKRSITFERNAGSAPETRTIGEIYNQGLLNVQAGNVPYKMEFVATESPTQFQMKTGTANKYGFAEGTKFKGEIISTPEPMSAPTINTVGRYSGPEYEARVLARQAMYESLPKDSFTSYQGGKKTIVVPENNPAISISALEPASIGAISRVSGIRDFAYPSAFSMGSSRASPVISAAMQNVYSPSGSKASEVSSPSLSSGAMRSPIRSSPSESSRSPSLMASVFNLPSPMRSPPSDMRSPISPQVPYIPKYTPSIYTPPSYVPPSYIPPYSPISPNSPSPPSPGKYEPPSYVPPPVILPIIPLLPTFPPTSVPGGGSPRRFRKFTEYMSFGGLGWKGSGLMSVGKNARRIKKMVATKAKRKK